MTLGIGSFGLAWLAGVLSTLSPCVLPLLPILVGSALSAHRRGLWALAFGLAVSFAALGLFVATAGISLGLDERIFRGVGATLLLIFGVIMLSSGLQRRFAAATSSLSSIGHDVLAKFNPDGWRGQLGVGVLMGVIWSPCVGPTLGAASTLAAQGQQLSHAGLLMLLFGLGAATPLVLFGLVSEEAMQRLRQRLFQTSAIGKPAMGLIFAVLGGVILLGIDKSAERLLVELSPDWLTALTTRY